MSWAQDLVRSDDWLVLDLETTDLDDDREPVELALLDALGAVAVSTLIRCSAPPTPEATRLHKLDSDALAFAPELSALMPTIRDHLEGRRVITYNSRFDQRTLDLALARRGQPPIRATWECLMERWTDYCGLRCSLAVASALADLPPCGLHHRALPDARRAWHLIHAMAARTAL